MSSETLQDLVKRRLAELGAPGRPMSGRQAAERSGGRVSYGTINNIAAGKHSGRVDEETVEGLVLALDVPRSRIEKAAGVYREGRPAAPFALPPRVNRLNLRERRLLMEFMDALLAAREEGRQERVKGEDPVSAGSPELAPEEIETVVIERGAGKAPFAVSRPRALGPMGEHERRQHIAQVERLEEETRRRGHGEAQSAP